MQLEKKELDLSEKLKELEKKDWELLEVRGENEERENWEKEIKMVLE